MSQVTSTVFQDRKEVVIKVNGRFDFSLHRVFRDAYRPHPGDLRYCVDLSNADYLDSSALGMLLLLREHAGGDKGHVRLKVVSKEILQLLSIARFDQLFKLA